MEATFLTKTFRSSINGAFGRHRARGFVCLRMSISEVILPFFQTQNPLQTPRCQKLKTIKLTPINNHDGNRDPLATNSRKNKRKTGGRNRARYCNSINEDQITLLSVISEVIKAIIADTVNSYLEGYQLLGHHQHGFRNNFSCTTNLLVY